MTFAHIRCECGTWHQWGAAYCERCGNQPVTARGRSVIPDVPDEDANEVVKTCIALNEALTWHHNRWAVA